MASIIAASNHVSWDREEKKNVNTCYDNDTSLTVTF